MVVQINIPEQLTLRVVSKGAGYDYFTPLFTMIGYDKTLNLDLDHEPNNPADTNAIVVKAGGIPVGYLVREDAVSFNRILHIIKKLEHEERIKVIANFVDFEPHKMPDNKRTFRYINVTIVKK